ncbi:MAG: pyridine nucleotide-disulfide oxidoreductase [Alphaproteobacteria bacterium]|nr:pyridine nucleotide-disulfide oxidoreductase [Alphaproteobacteria bacterium]
MIIGAGQAGAQAAASLRQEGFAGAITLLGEETPPPYQRPPLSKAYLMGALEESRLYLRPRDFYEKNAIELRLGARALRIDRAGKAVTLESGEALAYDKLLIATGAPPRRIPVPGADLPGVAYLRTIEDSDALRAVLAGARRLVIVGAGYIGLEVAAAARKAGLEVTILELAPRALSRVACPQVSAFFHDLHRAAGVDLRLETALAGFEGAGRLEAAVLQSGERVACEAALVCVGAAPETQLAEDAGLKVENGVWVDETAQTEDPSIWAAGDCANHPSVLYGRRVRLESVPNAIDQAKAAAANMTGKRVVYDATPWFWSDQYDVKLQTAGLGEGADQVIARGDPKSKRYAVFSLKQGRLLAVDAMNDPASFIAGKKLVALKASPNPKMLADPAADLKSLLAAPPKEQD